ncbi:MAG: carbohydrate binding domain-containing protein [Candidatus Hydrogenedentes bacterium]|nr:carbohydrate binding domain-containing protein [Candidatus Hydrogenedentota bacterium]
MNAFWKSRSVNERRLALVALGLVVLFLAYLVGGPAFRNLADLERQIEQREQDLITDTELAAHSEIVDREFAKIASEHSSKWTKQEIHDRLRQEIDRLAQQGPSGGNGPLVRIPVIPPGKLTEGGKDVREYQLTFKLAPASIGAVTEYLKRLHESPQALRVDGLELTRIPDMGQVIAQLDVTRTVVSGVADAAVAKAVTTAASTTQTNLIRNGSFEQAPKAPNVVNEWDVSGCTASPSKEFASDGSSSLAISGTQTGGAVSQKLELEAGATYEVRMDALVKIGSAIRAGVADATGKGVLEGAVTLSADGTARGYIYRFTAPGTAGTPATVRVPYIELPQGQPYEVYVDNVQLRKVSE